MNKFINFYLDYLSEFIENLKNNNFLKNKEKISKVNIKDEYFNNHKIQYIKSNEEDLSLGLYELMNLLIEILENKKQIDAEKKNDNFYKI